MELADHTDIPLQPRPAGCVVPLTAWQRRIWKQLTKQETPLSVRVCAASVRVLGPLNTDYLARSIEAVVQRHESLRTRIVTVGDIPRQQVDEAQSDQLEVIDLAGTSQSSTDAIAKLLAQEFIEEKIHLSVGPLFAAKLLRLSDREHVFILALDHMVSDAISYGVLSEEIWSLYEQAARALPFSLPPLPVQFADYAVWQQRTYDGWRKRHEAYWRGRLTGAPRLQLPIDDGSTEVNTPSAAMLHVPFGKALSVRLREMARRECTLLPLIVLTMYVAVVSRWCNQRDLVVAFVSHGRHRRPELERIIGLLANLLHFRMELSKEDSFLDVLRRVTLEFYAAYEHQDFDRAPDLIPECNADLYFNWIASNWTRRPAVQVEDAESPLKMQPFPIPVEPSRYRVDDSLRLRAACSDSDAGIVMTVWYRSDLLAASTMERFGQSLRLFAEVCTIRPLSSIASVSMDAT